MANVLNELCARQWKIQSLLPYILASTILPSFTFNLLTQPIFWATNSFLARTFNCWCVRLLLEMRNLSFSGGGSFLLTAFSRWLFACSLSGSICDRCIFVHVQFVHWAFLSISIADLFGFCLCFSFSLFYIRNNAPTRACRTIPWHFHSHWPPTQMFI